MEGAVPLTLALGVGVIALSFAGSNVGSLALDELSEKGLLAIGLTVVMVGGGIDLSVGAVVAATALTSLVAHRAWDFPMLLVVPGAVVLGALLGLVNGLLIGKAGMRPFITTLVTLLAFGGGARMLQAHYSIEIASPKPDFVWDVLREGRLAGVPIAWVIFFGVLLVVHIALTRSRWGWWITAVGSDRRSARRNGIPIDRVTVMLYVLSGALAGLSGLLLAARLGRTDPTVGQGLELVALTAVVLGGVSLQGGRGSVLRATIGMLVVILIFQATVSLGLEGAYYPTILALALLVFAVLDLKWGKYRALAAGKLKSDPGKVVLGTLPDITDPAGIWALNDKLTTAPPIGLGVIEGAEDIAIADDGTLYTGDRRGWVWRFAGPDYTDGTVFARTGGLVLGHAWDLEKNLVLAVGGMGVYRVDPDGEVSLAANRVRRTRLSLFDDSALRFADDLDVAPDGSIYVSDFSTRTNAAEYMLEMVELRANGRVVRIDPDGSTEIVTTNNVFPNGICTSHDGQSILVASTGLCRVDRLWISGIKQGQMEPVMENLPGYPDNINRASDGNYWMAFVAMRTPSSDLLVKYPDVRRRMIKELPVDNWVVPQMNVSCVLKFNEAGEVLKVLWDSSLEKYPMVTSVKEHHGHLFLAGVNNNRVGQFALDPEDIGPIDPGAVPGTQAARSKEAAR
jgi:ribose transport system permease protein